MKLIVKLDYEAMEEAVSDFLNRQMGRPIEIEKIEYLDEDGVWQVRLALVERESTRTVPLPPLGLEDVQLPGPPIEPPEDDAEDYGLTDGEDLPALTDEDLAERGIDLDTAEGKIQAREARREMAEARRERPRGMTHLG